MRLVIDFPGLPPEHVADVIAALDRAGFDAVIAGVAEAAGQAGFASTVYWISPLEGT